MHTHAAACICCVAFGDNVLRLILSRVPLTDGCYCSPDSYNLIGSSVRYGNNNDCRDWADIRRATTNDSMLPLPPRSIFQPLYKPDKRCLGWRGDFEIEILRNKAHKYCFIRLQAIFPEALTSPVRDVDISQPSIINIRAVHSASTSTSFTAHPLLSVHPAGIIEHEKHHRLLECQSQSPPCDFEKPSHLYCHAMPCPDGLLACISRCQSKHPACSLNQHPIASTSFSTALLSPRIRGTWR